MNKNVRGSTIMKGNHYFFAVKLPSEAKKFIHQWVMTNKEHFPFKRWVHPEDYHITLAFLGDQQIEMLERAIAAVGKIAKEEKPFELTFHQLGTFGKATEPRIFWLDVKPCERLTGIQKNVYNQCIKLGFSLDKKPFRPHITLARKWGGIDPFQMNLLDLYSFRKSFSFSVNQIVLYETHLDQTPKYKEYHVFQLDA